MSTAVVIGAGIAGPMAAIALRQYGYTVTMYDAKPAHDLHSDGILGITNENWLAMQESGVRLARFQLPFNTVTNYITGMTVNSPYQYITWTDLHIALTERASELGVSTYYGRTIDSDPTDADVIVRATGIGSAKEVSESRYTGYVIVRGLAYQFSGTPWTFLAGDNYRFLVGDTRDGASVTMFVKRENVQFRTTYTAVAPGEIKQLPERWKRLMETVPLFQQAPLSDWTVPETMVYPHGARKTIRIGDANGQLRPSTSMGANLAINEAMQVPLLANGDASDWQLILNRATETYRGQESEI